MIASACRWVGEYSDETLRAIALIGTLSAGPTKNTGINSSLKAQRFVWELTSIPYPTTVPAAKTVWVPAKPQSTAAPKVSMSDLTYLDLWARAQQKTADPAALPVKNPEVSQTW